MQATKVAGGQDPGLLPCLNYQCYATGGRLEWLVLSLMGVARGQYNYTSDLLELESHRPASPSSWCPRGPSLLWLNYLQGYGHSRPDTQFASYVLRRLSDSFHIGFAFPSPLRSVHHNAPFIMGKPQCDHGPPPSLSRPAAG